MQDQGSIVEGLLQRKTALTAEEVAELLGTSSVQIYRLARRGSLPSFRIASSVRFDPRKVAEFLRGSEGAR